jgi:pimeloyl-ACP methyl ester carboxylesterase
VLIFLAMPPPDSTMAQVSRKRRLARSVMILFTTFVVLLVGIMAYLVAVSPGQPRPVVDAAGQAIAGSLSERVFVEINGVRQGMIIQSADPSNPVLLVLHGGPGLPTFFLNGTHPTGLEQDFTVVWWEQRGAGLSFAPDIPPGTMTLEQLIADTIAVADHLRTRFGQERIMLLGHSWGSFLGLQVAARAPDRFIAYVGMAQVVHQLRSEILTHAALVAAYGERGDDRMVRRLQAAPVSTEDGLSDAWMRLRDAATHRIGGGTTRDMRSVVTGVFLPVWREPAYTLREKLAIWRGLRFSRHFLWDTVLNTDLSAQVTRLEIPVYFLIGRHDMTASPVLARALFDSIEAPVKGYYTFENSAHSPLFEEPGRAIQILLHDALNGRNLLADSN